MTVTITSDNFEQYFQSAMNSDFDSYYLQSLAAHGASDETAPEIPTQSLSTASLPLIQVNPITGVRSYVKITMASLIQAIADEVSTEGTLTSVTEEQFNAIFD